MARQEGYKLALMRCVLLCTAFILQACIIEAPTKASKRSLGTHTSSQQTHVGANFANLAELTSVTVNPPLASPGSTVHVLLTFRTLAKIEKNYEIFVHIEDVNRRMARIAKNHAPKAKPTSAWQPGELVTDNFDITFPEKLQAKKLNLIVGLWDSKTGRRLKLQNQTRVKNDGNNRVIVTTLPVTSVL